MHGVSGGAISAIDGGNFVSGFASGAISSLISSGIEKWGEKSILNKTGEEIGKIKEASYFKAVMIASGGLSGGISSSIAGGNFWVGVRQGVITSGLNHLAHYVADPPLKSVTTEIWYAKQDADGVWIINKIHDYIHLEKASKWKGSYDYQIYVFDKNNNVSIEFSGPYGKANFYKKYNELNIRNINNEKLQLNSLVLLGNAIKYSGTGIKQTSSLLIPATQGASSPGVFLGESLWWGGFGISSYGNYKLDQKDQIWKGLLMKGGATGAGQIWKKRKLYF